MVLKFTRNTFIVQFEFVFLDVKLIWPIKKNTHTHTHTHTETELRPLIMTV
jgi:hypothetical protein